MRGEHKPVQQPRELQRGDVCGMCSLHAEDDGCPHGGTDPSRLLPVKGQVPHIDCFPSPFQPVSDFQDQSSFLELELWFSNLSVYQLPEGLVKTNIVGAPTPEFLVQ